MWYVSSCSTSPCLYITGFDKRVLEQQEKEERERRLKRDHRRDERVCLTFHLRGNQ